MMVRRIENSHWSLSGIKSRCKTGNSWVYPLGSVLLNIFVNGLNNGAEHMIRNLLMTVGNGLYTKDLGCHPEGHGWPGEMGWHRWSFLCVSPMKKGWRSRAYSAWRNFGRLAMSIHTWKKGAKRIEPVSLFDVQCWDKRQRVKLEHRRVPLKTMNASVLCRWWAAGTGCLGDVESLPWRAPKAA